MNYILAVNYEIRTTAGHHIHIAVDVRDIYVAGSLAFRSPFSVERTEGSCTDC